MNYYLLFRLYSLGSGYTILALQFGDLTILVWVQFSEKLGVMVRRVKRSGMVNNEKKKLFFLSL